MRIGELSVRTGTHPQTIRYYERLGLLGRAKRNGAGDREFDEAAIERLECIAQLKSFGLSLDDVADVLQIRDRGRDFCAHVCALTEAKQRELERAIELAQALHRELQVIRDECALSQADGGAQCRARRHLAIARDTGCAT
jgi:DNA-binding transcriptional MerR regulator